MKRRILDYLPELFASILKKYNNGEESKIIKSIINFENYIQLNNYNQNLTIFQNVILLRMLVFWENKGVIHSENYTSKFDDYLNALKKYEYQITEDKEIIIFCDLVVKEDINEFFSYLIIHFLKKKEKDEIELIKQLWDEINLKNFEINEEIKNDLKEYLKNDDYYKELYEDNKLFELDNKDILNEIYDYINYKSPEFIKIELLKDYADQERQYDDYGRTIQINEKEPAFDDKLNIKKNEKIPDNILKQVFKKWQIEISINLNKKPNYNYYYGETLEPMEQLYDNYNYNMSNKDEKNYKEYINFDKKVRNFVNDNINNIKKSGTIKLILTTFKEEQKNNEKIPEKLKSLYIVDCESYFENDEKNSKDNNFEKFIDNNVLINGINGKTPGFIFLINELCNEDYKAGCF